jgi:hypothetical protein
MLKRLWSLISATLLLTIPGILLSPGKASGQQNLIQNPGFEESSGGGDILSGWSMTPDSEGKAQSTRKEVHAGNAAIEVPANSSIEQRTKALPVGAYVCRCWAKSPIAQTVTLLIRNPEQPWLAYSCAEIKLPAKEWVKVEGFCAVNAQGPLSIAFGGVSKEFHQYHGTGQDMTAPIMVDDFELMRYEPKNDGRVSVWEADKASGLEAVLAARDRWSSITTPTHHFSGLPILQAGKTLITLREIDGALLVYSSDGNKIVERCVALPFPALSKAACGLVRNGEQLGIQVRSGSGENSYTAWISNHGLIHLEPDRIARFELQDCHLRYGILPSFVGTDLCVSPRQVAGAKEFCLPSTQWFVGLVDGHNTMMVAAWETNTQSVRVSAAGGAGNELIEKVSVGTSSGGLFLSFIESPGLWHQEALKEDWLGDYIPIAWQRPFPARWMGHLYVTAGKKSSFRDPGIGYSFPIACAKTRMWGVWFEDWNHYPFFFDGAQTVLHFEKTFLPQGEAVIYFLEPAAADIYSPVEIVEQALGPERAAALFDFGANQLKTLKYSTPPRFVLDRPVCATTTRLSKIKQEEKPTFGVDLATHLYEFIREIRGRVDEYQAFFDQTKDYVSARESDPKLHDYAKILENMVSEGQQQAEHIYATPLPTVETKVEKMKALLREGKGDGFDCGNLDVRNTAGDQDDLCRRDNRYVIKLVQTAALQCGDSPEKAEIATHIWESARTVLRRPTRWEPRRTLYFFEP